MEDLSGDWRRLDERIQHVTEEIEVLAHGSESCRQLMSVPGIGPIIASAMVAAIGNGAAFAKGRDFAAWLGLVPKPAEAATLVLSWMTAYQLLHRAAPVQRAQRVLVHGAAGAVGQALLVLGSMAGLELWGGAHGRHAALIRELGAIPIDYQRERSP